MGIYEASNERHLSFGIELYGSKDSVDMDCDARGDVMMGNDGLPWRP